MTFYVFSLLEIFNLHDESKKRTTYSDWTTTKDYNKRECVEKRPFLHVCPEFDGFTLVEEMLVNILIPNLP